MHPPGADTVLVRTGDVNVKSTSVQRRMERRLVENVEAILADRGISGDVERRWSRLFVHTDEDSVADAAGAAADAFGVVSTSPALAVEPTKDVIERALVETAHEVYDGGTFAVDARRAYKDYPFTSSDIQHDCGAAIWAAVEDDFEPAVDLDDPDVTFSVEVREDAAYLFVEYVAGPGGLPLRSQGSLVALISGGIDSPVAAYEAMKRGSPVVPVYIELGDYGGLDHEARAMETVRRLQRYAPNVDLRPYRVPGGATVAHLAETMEEGRMLSLRRFFFRIGQHVAEREGAYGIVTGEAIGQKSSQTVENLAVTGRATDLPIHRPLLTMDKQEIVARAREVGTYADSTINAGCNRVAPDRPRTSASLEELLEDEPDDLFERAKDVAEAAERVEP